jgi:hypothetical protein
MMSAGSLVVLVVAVQQTESFVRAGGIALGSWFPALTAALGTLIALRQPGNRIAWILNGIGFAVLIEMALQLLLSSGPVAPALLNLGALVLLHVALPAALYLAFLVPLMFPSGSFFSKSQSLMAWPGAIMLFILPLTVALAQEVGPPFPSDGLAWTVDNAVGILPVTVLSVSIGLMIGAVAFTAVGGFFSLAIRYRRSSSVAKAQIRWLLYSTVIVAGIFVLLVASDASQSAVGGLLLVVAFVSIPASITVAITRYRLFAIDRIISRTLTYPVLVATLGLVFAAGVVWIPSALSLEDSPLVIAGSTLAVASLFNPLRKRVQAGIDRRFNRSALHGQVVSQAFAARLSEPLTTVQILSEWQTTVTESLQPETIGVWVRRRGTNGPE